MTTAPPRRASTFLLVSGGRVALQACWFATTWFLSKQLGREMWGVYFLATSAIRILVGSVGDPIDMAVMREAPLHIHGDRWRALELIRSAFWLRVAIAALLLL